jgi:hypothetical protein
MWERWITCSWVQARKGHCSLRRSRSIAAIPARRLAAAVALRSCYGCCGGTIDAMVRREDNGGSQDPKLSRCASPARASPASVSVGAPSSRSPEPREIAEAEARRREPSNGRQGRGPQHEVKIAASTDTQSGSRAAHVTAKATSSTRTSEANVEDSRGVQIAARVHGEARNTGDPSAQFVVTSTRLDQADGQAIAVQRKSEGIIVLI